MRLRSMIADSNFQTKATRINEDLLIRKRMDHSIDAYHDSMCDELMLKIEQQKTMHWNRILSNPILSTDWTLSHCSLIDDYSNLQDSSLSFPRRALFFIPFPSIHSTLSSDHVGRLSYPFPFCWNNWYTRDSFRPHLCFFSLIQLNQKISMELYQPPPEENQFMLEVIPRARTLYILAGALFSWETSRYITSSFLSLLANRKASYTLGFFI